MSAEYLDFEYEENLPEFIPSEVAEILKPSVALMYGVVPESVREESIALRCRPF